MKYKHATIIYENKQYNVLLGNTFEKMDPLNFDIKLEGGTFEDAVQVAVKNVKSKPGTINHRFVFSPTVIFRIVKEKGSATIHNPPKEENKRGET